ncbi:MAG: hypothetical protein Q9207_004927 [Kuettlingeria erythrocarpa]
MSVASRFSKEGNPELIYWPKHLLPETLPSARVLVYGYDTKIRHALGAPISKNTVYDIALDFLGSLEAQRRSEPSRPLVFIAHSLGGIVVKELLRRSYGFSDHQRHLHEIFKATSAIIFFGTPHGGADPRRVREHLIERVARAAGLTVNEQIVNTLLPTSERLRELRDEFGPLARRQNWVVYSFQEQYGVQLLGDRKVVEDVSSCLGNSELEIIQHIASNHMEMCRFSGLHDHEYTKVAAALEYIKNLLPTDHAEARVPETDPVLKSEQRQSILDALSFHAIDARYYTVKAAHAKTCKWLLRRPEYHDWCDVSKNHEHHGLLWIKGKPGSGKSTLLKFAVQNTRRTNKDAKVICFFFNARGEDLEKTTLGMYRTLLFHLLSEFPDLQSVLDSFRLSGMQEGESYNWRQSDLQDLLAAAIQKLGQRQLICFIDALDECDEDQIRDLVLFLQEIGRLTISPRINFRVCLSSRHYPHISIENGMELTLERQEGHVEDIARYLDSELQAGKGNQMKAIKEEILTRASGIFLWVALVVQILNREYDHGRVHALRKRLREIPDGLDKLFEDILTRDRVNSEELVLCLQWILYSTRPLVREELYYAILSGADDEALMDSALEMLTSEDMDRFILSCSKGLAETTKSKSPTVQFIHESVRDFLLGNNGFSRLKPELEAGRSHNRLKQCCCVYSKVNLSRFLPLDADMPQASSERAKELRRRVTTRFPFLTYAVNNALIHADSAGKHGVSQASFLHEFSIGNWVELYNMLQRYQVRRYSKDIVSNILYFWVQKDLTNLVRTWMQTLWESYQVFAASCLRNEDYITSVDATLRDSKISDNTVRALLLPTFLTGGDDEERLENHRDCDIDIERCAVEMIIKNRSDIVASEGQHVYHWAAAGGHHAGMRVLLTRTKLRPRIQLDQGNAPIIIAASGGHVAVVELLLDNGFASTDFRDQQGRSPLSWAASNGHEEIVRLLLAGNSEGADFVDRTGRSPLVWAAGNGHVAVVELLLAKKGNTFNSTREGEMSLTWAASNDHGEIVKLLLAKVSVGVVDKCGREARNALSWAAGNGHVNVVELLLASGAEANCKDTRGRIPLSWAAESGHLAVVNLLLAVDTVDANAEDQGGRTALSYAAERGNTAIVQILLAKDPVFADYVDAQGRTPLAHAASIGHEEIVRLLLLTMSRVTGKTALRLATRNGHAAVVKVLISKLSTRYRHQDLIDREAFEVAAYNRHYAVMNLLLAMGSVDLDIEDARANSALYYAASHGYLEKDVLNLVRAQGLPVPDPSVVPNGGPATGDMAAGTTTSTSTISES